MPDTEAKPRKNLTWACDSCRKSKVKCSGETPCARCATRNTDCNYTPQKKRGYPKKRARAKNVVSKQSKPGRKKRKLNQESVQFSRIRQDIMEILIDEEERKNLLEFYETYFHNQATMRLVDISRIWNPQKESDYLCQIIAFLYSTNSKYPTKIEQLQNMMFHIASSLIDDNTLDSLIAITVLLRYCFGTNETKCLEWRDVALSKFKKFIVENDKPEYFFRLYKVRTMIVFNSEVERQCHENELLDQVQQEYINILNLPEDEVLSQYKHPKKEFQMFYSLVGDPVYRIYYHYIYRIDSDLSSNMTSPPWLSIEQVDSIFCHIDSVFPNISGTIGIRKSHPFMKELVDLHKSAVYESINNSPESLKLARGCLNYIMQNIDIADRAPYYIIMILQSLFRTFLRNSCIHEALKVNELHYIYGKTYPRLISLAKINEERFNQLNLNRSPQSLFEEPISLQQLVRQKLNITFQTKIPLLSLEPKKIPERINPNQIHFFDFIRV